MKRYERKRCWNSDPPSKRLKTEVAIETDKGVADDKLEIKLEPSQSPSPCTGLPEQNFDSDHIVKVEPEFDVQLAGHVLILDGGGCDCRVKAENSDPESDPLALPGDAEATAAPFFRYDF